jgi:hypothetical protein
MSAYPFAAPILKVRYGVARPRNADLSHLLGQMLS